jgi:hypothetical protein
MKVTKLSTEQHANVTFRVLVWSHHFSLHSREIFKWTSSFRHMSLFYCPSRSCWLFYSIFYGWVFLCVCAHVHFKFLPLDFKQKQKKCTWYWTWPKRDEENCLNIIIWFFFYRICSKEFAKRPWSITLENTVSKI